MDVEVVAALAAVLGLSGGVAVTTVLRRGDRAPEPTPPPRPAQAPDGVAQVLAVLKSSAVVLDGSDAVVQASPSAYAVGLVRGDRLAVDELLAMARRVRRDRQIRQAELELPRGPVGGATTAVSARVAPLTGDLVLLLLDDHTESRRVDAVRRDFVANVSHELKTPVGALSLLAEAMVDASDDPQAVRRFAGRMRHETARLSALVQELIDLSRLQGHDPLREPGVVPVDDVVAEAVDRSRLSAAAKDITLVTGGTQGSTVLGDRGQLITALRNLVDNAISYSPEHTQVAVGVRRAGTAPHDLVEVTVTDQGIGIPEADRERIFERFYRVDPARSRETGGTGLGLSIAKHIVTNHGGDLRVWSVEGAGSTFTMRLPARAGAQAATLDSAESESRRPADREVLR